MSIHVRPLCTTLRTTWVNKEKLLDSLMQCARKEGCDSHFYTKTYIVGTQKINLKHDSTYQ